MGLVVQAPAETAALPGIAAPATDAPRAGNDVFAALLQSLLSDSAGAATVAAPSAADPGLVLPAVPSKDGDSDDNPIADAIAAALAALQVLPQLMPVQAAPDTAAGAAPAGAPGPAVSAVPLTSLQPAGAGAPAEATPADDTSPRAIGPAAAATVAPAAQPAAPAAQTPSPDGASVVAAAEGQPSAVIEASNAHPAKSAEKAPAADDPPPTEAGIAPANDTQVSVVRFVGNAQHENQPGQGNAGDGRPKSGEFNVAHPHASAEGIAHAAPNSPVGELRADAAAAPADAPQGAPSTPEIPQPVHQVSQAVLDQVGRGDGEARIHLDPVELGQVTIRVKTEGDHVRVEVHAERAEVMNLLRDHSADLSSLLGSRGLNLSDVYVGLGGQGARNSQGGEQQQRGERPANGQFASILGAGEAPAIELHNRLRTAYNPDGALSYRV